MHYESGWRDLPSEDPLKKDRLAEEGVLCFVLDEHPTHLTLAELVRELTGERPEGAERTQRAVGALTGAGLLHRSGEFVLPARAALRFRELSD